LLPDPDFLLRIGKSDYGKYSGVNSDLKDVEDVVLIPDNIREEELGVNPDLQKQLIANFFPDPRVGVASTLHTCK
jgi:hypothetical protein